MVSTRSKSRPSASRRTRSQTAGAPPVLQSTPTKRTKRTSKTTSSGQRGQRANATPVVTQQRPAAMNSPPRMNGAGPSNPSPVSTRRGRRPLFGSGIPPRPPQQMAVARAVQSHAAAAAARPRPVTSQNNARASNQNLPPTAPLSRANGNTSNGSVENVGRARSGRNNGTRRSLKKQKALLKLKDAKIRAKRAEVRAREERKRLEKAKKRAAQGGFWKKVGGVAVGALTFAGGAAARACAMNPKECKLGYLQARGAYEVRAAQNRAMRALEPVYSPPTTLTPNLKPMGIHNGHSLMTKFRRNRRGYLGNPPPPRFP
jgi:hypothetical protein